MVTAGKPSFGKSLIAFGLVMLLVILCATHASAATLKMGYWWLSLGKLFLLWGNDVQSYALNYLPDDT